LKSSGYTEIVSLLKSPATKALVLFVVSLADLFAGFTGMFQREDPLVHVLYEEMSRLLLILLSRCLKPDVLADIHRRRSVVVADLDVFDNFLSLENVE
jgi:hypothetical protein